MTRGTPSRQLFNIEPGMLQVASNWNYAAMDQKGHATVATASNGPVLERILNRVFQCSHRHLGRPMTLNGESFAQCLDCGRRVAYDLREFRTGASSLSKTASQITVPINPRPILLKRRAACGWVLAISFTSAGFFFLVHRPHTRNQYLTSRRAVHRVRAAEPPATGLKPTAAPISNTAAPTPLIPASDSVAHLEGDGRVAVLARDVASGLELSHHPGRLGELIQRGSLFTVPPGTTVRVRSRKKTVVRVSVLSGPMAGQQGWAQASQVSRGAGDLVAGGSTARR